MLLATIASYVGPWLVLLGLLFVIAFMVTAADRLLEYWLGRPSLERQYQRLEGRVRQLEEETRQRWSR